MIRAFLMAALLGLAAGTIPSRADEQGAMTSDAFDFGDDDSVYAMNGACEDPRFLATGTEPAEDALLHDAGDCLTLFANGEVEISEQGRSLHPEGPLDILDILTRISKGGGKATDPQ